jgi:hypothetical protein
MPPPGAGREAPRPGAGVRGGVKIDCLLALRYGSAPYAI